MPCSNCLVVSCMIPAGMVDSTVANSGAAARKGRQAEPHIYHAKEKETHELIFSWFSWLAVLLVGAYARRRRRRSRATWRPYSKKEVDRNKALVYCVFLWYWTTMLRSIDTCQDRVSADQYHVATSRAQVDSSSRSHFLKFTADQVLVFRLDRGLMSG